VDKAYGDERYSSAGLVSTSYRYTGQPLEPSLNLYLMGARWYDPYLNRVRPVRSKPPETGGG